MSKLFKSVAFGVLTFISMQSFAHDNPDQKTTCYLFQNNKLKSKQSCIMSSGGGAGGMFTILKMCKKSYHFETSTMSQEYPTFYYETDTETKNVTEYSRDSKTLRILSDAQLDKAKEPLWCYKTQDKKLDICYK